MISDTETKEQAKNFKREENENENIELSSSLNNIR